MGIGNYSSWSFLLINLKFVKYAIPEINLTTALSLRIKIKYYLTEKVSDNVLDPSSRIRPGVLIPGCLTLIKAVVCKLL